MHAPEIIARTMSKRARRDDYGNPWQYNSRSDHHSRISCWAILFDLLNHSAVLRQHAGAGEIAFGINHKMRDFRYNREKSLDLVICTPGSKNDKARSLLDYADYLEVELTPAERNNLNRLPDIYEAPVGSVRVALEAKACMTAHQKAKPRLFDELNSSQQTIHGAADAAIAVGLAMVNLASSFLSPGRNHFPIAESSPNVNRHVQPKAAREVIEKIREIPRRSKMGQDGFDALSVVVVLCRNDGSPVRIATEQPAPSRDDSLNYESMVHRLVDLYTSRFKYN